MEIKEYISSGVIELYCLGIATAEEQREIEQLASDNEEIRNEIASVNEALRIFAAASEKKPAASLKSKIMDAIVASSSNAPKIQLPPRLSDNSTVEEWLSYLSDHNITAPATYDPVHWIDLPSDEKQATYVVWAKKGTVVEESHDDEDEYLFMMHGRCSITIDGKLGYYTTGDLVYIPKQSVHRAEALSDEPMLLIGQRVAA